MNEQRYDPTAAGARASNPVPATSEYNYHNPDVAALASATGANAPGHHSSQTQQPYTTAQMAQQAQGYKSPEINNNDLGPRDNSSRNAALGAGAGLAGAAAVGHAAHHHNDSTHQAPLSQNQGYASSAQPGSSTLPQPTGSLTQAEQYPHNTDPSQSHTGRDAALVGGAGAAAGAGAGYAYGQRQQPQFDPKEQEKLDKEAAKHQHDLEKKHDKYLHKLEKEHEKDLKKHEKEDAHHDKSEKKGGILGFLHRDKKDKSPSPETTPRQSEDHHYGRDAAVAGGVGAGAAGLAHESDQFGHGSGYKGKNLLHKDPPPGHPAREALEGGHANDRVGVDGPIGTSRAYDEPTRSEEHHYGRDAAIGGGALGAGGLAAHELHDRNRTDPTLTNVGYDGTQPIVEPSDTTTIGHPQSGLTGSQPAVVPGTSTVGHSETGLAGSERTPAHHAFTGGKREHVGVDGPIGDPEMISGDR
jgi:hypothetical protein